MSDQHQVRVAIIGVGNCASALVQGVQFYKNTAETDQVPGLMHTNLGGYHVRDIEFAAAFDVVDTKVCKDLSEAIFAYPNNTIKFTEVAHMNVPVSRGMTHDGLGKYLSEIVTKAPGPTADIVGILKETKTDVVVNFLPVGSEMATKMVCRTGAGGRLRLRQRHSGVHCQFGILVAALPRTRNADDWRRYQEPGRGYDLAPRVDQPVRRSGRAT
jgi:myo-inositol-1-phosphate synthase